MADSSCDLARRPADSCFAGGPSNEEIRELQQEHLRLHQRTQESRLKVANVKRVSRLKAAESRQTEREELRCQQGAVEGEAVREAMNTCR